MRTTRILVAASLIAMSGLLVSCSSAGVGDKRETGIPDGLKLDEPTEGPIVIAHQDGSVDVVTQGSSSCPPTATAIEVDGDELLVTFEVSKNSVCTADIAPTTHSFAATTVGRNVPDTARLIFPEADEEVAVDVIRE
jgi:hypothetical protein